MNFVPFMARIGVKKMIMVGGWIYASKVATIADEEYFFLSKTRE